MATKSTKSARFISLLPIIYSKLILLGATHAEVSDWLNEEHGLEFKGRTFSNYLSKYGDIKTAKENFDKEARKKNVAESWASSANNEVATYSSPSLATAKVSTDNKGSTVNNEVSVKPPQAQRSVRISDQLGVKRQPQKNQVMSSESLLEGYEESNSL